MRRRSWFIVFGALALAALAVVLLREKPGPKDELGLFTSLPVMMGEAGDVAEVISRPPEPHWAKEALSERFRLRSFDTLRPPGSLRFLLVAQPRPLSPEENVALDDWVRGGGRLLLLADPMATFESRFAIGDPRRPQDTVLLSPILARWGLQLRFDEDQQPGEREIAGWPVNLPGSLAPAPGAQCRTEAQGLLADCRIGSGRAVILADSALLDDPRFRPALDALLSRAFGS